MITPPELDTFLAVLRKHNVMSAHLESGPDKIAVTLGPEFPAMDTDVPAELVPGGWKTQAPDSYDPDPLGLGNLDAAPAIEDIDVEGTEL
jgi:hypothetical protein